MRHLDTRKDLKNGFDVLMKPILNAFFLDFDTDFYGDPLNFVIEEIMPSGYVANSLDCSDENAYENPSENVPCNCSGGVSQALGSEICYNGFDDDCNGDENEDCPPVCRESNSDPAPFQGCFCGSNSTCSSPNYCCATGDYAGSCVDDCTSYVPT